MKLIAAEAAGDLSSLRFSGCTLSAYSRYQSSEPLSSLVGLTVSSVRYSPDQAVTVTFSSQATFSISLAPADYTGPEAFGARFDNGPWIVE